MKIMKKRTYAIEPRWLLIFAFFAAGIFMGGLVLYLFESTQGSDSFKIHPQNLGYHYINPLLAVDTYSNKQFFKDKTLEVKLQGLIDQEKRSGTISEASLYFRDLEPGDWVSLNESNQFSPGRLLKIPIMITYYKLAESNPEILNETIHYTATTSDVALDPMITAPDDLVSGETYTVDSLIERMIIFSNATAARLLFEHIDKDPLTEVFSDLGISFAEQVQTDDMITLKQYSLFFRVLYNATYLNRAYSEKALGLLVQADDTIGLGAGVPKSVPVANRFGSRIKNGIGSIKNYEAYDCGVFYYPGHPYLLCSVLQARNLQNILTFFKQMGSAVYTEIDYKYKNTESNPQGI